MAVTFLCGFASQAPLIERVTLTGSCSMYSGSGRTGTGYVTAYPASGVSGYLTLGVASSYQHFGMQADILPSIDRLVFGAISAGTINVRLTSAGALAVYLNTTLIGTSSAAFASVGWHWVGIRQVTGTSVAFLQIDGVDEVTGTATVTATSAIVGASGTEASMVQVEIDDVIGDDAGFLAPSKVALLLPISDNYRDTLWTGGVGGTTNLYDAVNNCPPIGTATETDLTQIEHAGGAAGSTDQYAANLTTYTNAGVGASDTVIALQGVVVWGEDSATGTKMLSWAAASNPGSTIGVGSTDVSTGHGSGAVGTYSTGTDYWNESRFLATSGYGTLTLGSSPVLRVSRPETATRVASVCFIGMYVAWTPPFSTLQSVTPGLIDATKAIYAPTLAFPTQSLTLGLIDAGSAIYEPTVIATQIVSLDLIDSASAIYAPTLVGKNALTVGLIDSVSDIYAPTLVGKSALTVSLIDAGSAIYAPVVGFSLGLPLIDAGAAAYAPTVVHQALPIVQGTASGVDATATTTHVFNLPSGVQAGDLIFFIATANASTGEITPPAGWLPNTDNTDPSYLGYGGSVIALSYYKIAAGGETTVSFTTVNSMRYAYVTYRISGVWDGDPGDAASPMLLWAGTSYPYSSGTSTNPDPPSTSWPADRDTAWIAVAFSASVNVATAAPSGYSGLVTTPALTNAEMISAAHKVVRRSTSEDPGVFTLVNGYWNAYTIGVRGKYFGSDGVALGLIPNGPTKAVYGLTVGKAPYPIALGLIDAGSAIYQPTVVTQQVLALSLIDSARVMVVDDTFTDAGTGVADLSTHTPELGGPWVRAFGGGNYPNAGYLDIDKDNDYVEPSGFITQGAWDYGSSVYRAGEIADGFVEGNLSVGSNGGSSGLVIRQSGASYYDNFYVYFGGWLYRVTGGVISSLGSHIYSGPWYRIEVSGINPTRITLRSALTREGLDSATATVYNDSTAGNQRVSGYVGIYGTTEDQNGMVFSGPVDGFRAVARDVIPPLSAKNVNTVALGVIESTPAIYDITVVPQAVAAALPLIDAGSAIYAPIFTTLETLTIGLIDAGSAIYASVVTKVPYPISLGLIDAGSAIYAPVVVGGGAVVVFPDLIDAGSEIYALTAIIDQFVSPDTIESAPAIYGLTLTAKNGVSLGLIDAAPEIYSLTVARTNTFIVGLIDSVSAIYAPVVGFSLGLPLIDSVGAIYAPVLTPKNDLTVGVITSTSAIYSLSIAKAPYPITLPLIDAAGAVFAPYVEGGGNVFVFPDLIDGGAAVYALSVQQQQFLSLDLIYARGFFQPARSVAVASSDYAITSDGAYLYGLGFSYVKKIRLSDLTEVDSLGIGSGDGYGIVISPDDAYLYISSWDADTVRKIQTSTMTVVDTCSLGGGHDPIGLAISADGAYVYVANRNGNTVEEIQTSDMTVARTCSLGGSHGPNHVRISSNGLYLFVTNYTANTVERILISTMIVNGTCSLGASHGPEDVAVSADGAYVYVTNSLSFTVEKIATSSMAVVGTCDLSPDTNWPDRIVLSSDGYLYVSSGNSGHTRQINTTSMAVTADLYLGSGALTLSLDQSILYVQSGDLYEVPLTDGVFALTLRGTSGLAVGLIDSVSAIYPVTAQATNTLVVGLIDGGSATYAPTLVVGPVTITLGVVGANPVVYELSTSGAQIVQLGAIEQATEIYAPTLTVGSVGVTLDLIDASAPPYSPTLSHVVALDLIDRASAIYDPSVVLVTVIGLGLIDSGAAVYAPTLYFTISLDVVGHGPWIWPLLTYAEGVVEGTSDVAFTWEQTAGGFTPITGSSDTTFQWEPSGWGTFAATFGTSAVAFGWTTGAGAGTEGMSGAAASAFGWSQQFSAYVTHPTDSSFTFATAGVGWAPILGTSDVSFIWLPFGGGSAGYTGTGASSFGWNATGGAGAAGAAGSGASSFLWTTGAGAGEVAEPVTGTGASDFRWQDSTGVGWQVEDDSVIGYSDTAFGWEIITTTTIQPGTGIVIGRSGDTVWVSITS